MSESTSAVVDKPESDVYSPDGQSQKKTFRPLSYIIMAFLLYLLPQFLAFGSMSAYYEITGRGSDFQGLVEDGDIGVTFTLYLLIQVFLLVVIALVMKSLNLRLHDLGVRIRGLGKAWMVLPAFVFYYMLTIYLSLLSTFVFSEETLSQTQETGFGDASGTIEVLFAFVALVVLAPLAEELLFRGFLFKRIRRDWPFWMTAVVTAVLFGLAHFQINVAIDTFALALPLAYLVEKTGSIWASVGLHASKNLVAFVLLFILDIEVEAAFLHLPF